MSVLRYSRGLQLCFMVSGAYLTWYLMRENGTASELESYWNLQVLPGTEASLRRTFSGIAALDKGLSFFNCIIWVVVNGTSPDISLHAYLFAGQLAAAYGLLMLEAARNGNRGKITSFVMVWGMLMLRCGCSTIGPLFSVLHLSISPTTTPTKSNTAVQAVDSLSVIFAVICGCVAPSIAISLPTPSIVTYDMKQMIMALWQVYPVWVSFFYYLSKQSFNIFVTSLRLRSTEGNPHQQMDANALRIAYSFLILLAGFTHIHAWSLGLTATLLPQLFAPNVIKALHYSNAFSPAAMTPSTKMPSVPSGIALFLKWDEVISVSAFFLWTLVLYIQAKHQRGESVTPGLLLQLLVGTTVAGPTTGAAALMWARDELIMGSDDRKR